MVLGCVGRTCFPVFSLCIGEVFLKFYRFGWWLLLHSIFQLNLQRCIHFYGGFYKRFLIVLGFSE